MINNLKMEIWPTEKLIEYARNPRNNDDVVDQMVSVIKEFGFRVPIVARSDGLVVDGHLRLKAARAIGLKEVPVILADELTDTQVKAFRILANKSASWAEWDDELLRLEFEDLNNEAFNLELTGFSEEELNDILISGEDYSREYTDGSKRNKSSDNESEKDYSSKNKEIEVDNLIHDGVECPKCKFIFEVKNNA